MDYIVGVISLVSVALNFLIYQKVRRLDTVITFEVTNVELPEPELVTEEVAPEELVSPLTAQPVQDVYQGWRNQSGIPWTEPIKPPEKVTQAPNRGPLARPDGFV